MIKILKFKNSLNINKFYRFYSSGGTAQSTQSFLLNKQQNVNSKLSFKTLENNGILPLSLSTIAIDSDNYSLYDNEHKAILIKSIKNGCNVIKSTNESKLLQNVLSDLLDNNEIKRSELVYIKKSKPLKTSLPPNFTDSSVLLEPLSVSSIDLQIKKAFQDISLETIDIFILDLNNIMKIVKQQEGNVNIYKILQDEIFPHLQSLVSKGKIQSYGISSNDFSDSDGTGLSAEKLVEIKNNNNLSHFLFIEYPFNLYQNQAIVNKIYKSKTTSEPLNLYEYLKENQISTINNSPNSFIESINNSICRFEMVPNHSDQDIQTQLKEAFNIAIHLESNNPIFKDSVLQQTLLQDKSLIGSLQWAHNLVYESGRNKVLSNLWLWKPILSTKIHPTVTEAILSVFGNHVVNTWGGNYRKAIEQLFSIYTKSLELQTYQQQSDMNMLFNSLLNNNEFKQFSNDPNHQKLSMLQKSTLLSSIGSDILLESPTSTNNLKSIQSDIQINNNPNDKNSILPIFINLSKHLIKLINEKNTNINLNENKIIEN
ncbi:hypothetical protein DICPUDRAFT_146468 [Dictyostelium purpureum]|uniref:NADP-dependent oxidoreductase domain-containing protein n=1 Tax=Dictyostelium purpureum TaxID=5786 RepID=F0Z619_DICPU|nr:uncharacterized protein DICPUDRAFT_146468 [Dictyostelium purpureum]EGC40577.1 hypothetical protein DICPUDRAFT_146468 [Dictyostelium purpureum]|eukprot:XP_003282913.1 hypothetical protein DICPUDRAFT_146468 [Dictyostelium purpureum]